MFQSVVDYFTSIDPILAALYASLFTWFLTALGASSFLCLKV
jgi:ZIP family zinc transporter